jgi:hypothetical protein
MLAAGFGRFNRGFERLSHSYVRLTRQLVVHGLPVVLAVYIAPIAAAGIEFSRAPTVSEQDQGYLITVMQLSFRLHTLGEHMAVPAVVVQFELGLSRLPLKHAFCYADSTASQMVGARLSLRRSLPRLN